MFRLYLYKFLIDFWVIVPVIVPFYRSHGLNATRIFTIQAAFSLSQFLFEIPSGYLADVVGRRRTLILSALFMMAGIGIYTASTCFIQFVAAEIILGLAGALRSGTDSAYLYDYLQNINDEHRYRRYEGIAEFWSRTGTAVSSIAGGVLAAFVTLRLPFYVNLVSAFVMLVTGISLREPLRAKKPEGNALANILRITRKSITCPALFSVMLQMSLMFSMGVTAIWGYFILYRNFAIPLFWHGIIFAAMQLTSAFSARHGAAIEKRLGQRLTPFLLCGPGILLIASGAARHPAILLPLVFFLAAIWGMSTPILLGKIQDLTSSKVRATTLSVGSMVGRTLTILLGPLFGYCTDRFSVEWAFAGMGILFLVAFPGAIRLASFRPSTDHIDIRQDVEPVAD